MEGCYRIRRIVSSHLSVTLLTEEDEEERTSPIDLAQQQQLARASVDSLTDVSDFDVSLSFSRCVASNSRHSPQKPAQTTTSEDDARMVSGAIVRSDTVELRSSQQWQSQTTTATTTSVSATVTEASQDLHVL